jgi:hypothetical protein
VGEPLQAHLLCRQVTQAGSGCRGVRQASSGLGSHSAWWLAGHPGLARCAPATVSGRVSPSAGCWCPPPRPTSSLEQTVGPGASHCIFFVPPAAQQKVPAQCIKCPTPSPRAGSRGLLSEHRHACACSPRTLVHLPAWCMRSPQHAGLHCIALHLYCAVLHSTEQHSTAQHLPLSSRSPVPLVPCRSWYSSLPSSSPLPRPGTSVVRHHSAMRLSGRVGSSAAAAAEGAASQAVNCRVPVAGRLPGAATGSLARGQLRCEQGGTGVAHPRNP